MIKKTITYTDFDGVERTEDFYFNLSKAELMEMEMSADGGMAKYLQQIVDTKDTKQLIEIFKSIVVKAYGIKSLDGKRFIKNQEVLNDFTQSEAYSELFMELLSNADAAATFFNGIIPAQLLNK